MTDAAPEPPKDTHSGRPTHWAHPVDERRRASRARRARRRRVALIVIALVAVALVVSYYHLTSDERVEKFAEAYLGDLLGTDVNIGRASFSWGEGLVLEQIGVSPPKPFSERILEAEQVDLKIAPLSLLRLAPEVTEIVVHKPRITLVWWNDEVWNFESLVKARRPGSAAPALRPVIALEEGTLRVVRKRDGEPIYDHEMQASGLLIPNEADRDAFRFQTDVKSQKVHLAVASGELNVQKPALRFEGQASNVTLSPELYRSLPDEVQRIWDRFDPQGSVNIKVLFDEGQGFRLETELTGISFDYRHSPYAGAPAVFLWAPIRWVFDPIAEASVQTFAFENLTGRCRFSTTALELTGVQGLLNGRPIRLDGDVWGFDRNRLAMKLTVEADRVDFGRSRPALVALAPHMKRLFEVYSPRGQADLALTVNRTEDEDAKLEIAGTISCRDMEMTYHLFPYRLTRIHGKVHFSPKRYETEGIEGYHGRTEVMLKGVGENPGPLIESRVTVQAREVELDEDLRAALREAQRVVYDRFSPSGVADIDVAVYRPPRRGARPEVTVDVTLRDCRILYDGFPYQLTGTTGKIIISPGGKTEIVGVEGRHGDATVSLSGTSLSGGTGREPKLDLKVVGRNVAFDDDLEEALPERERNILRVFHLSGLADFEGTVTRGPETEGKLDYELAIRLKNARMIYEPFPFLAEEVTGKLTLARGSCRIDSLEGFNSGARIEARGWIEQKPDDYAMDLTLTGKDVALGESLRGALGPDMRSVWSHLAPRGRVDITAHLMKDLGADEKVRHHVWVTARDAQATLDIFPYPLEHVAGQMEFLGNEVVLHEVRARTGLTEFLLAGRIAYDEVGPTFSLAVQAKGLRFDGALRDALPEPLRKAFDLLRPSGRIDLDIEQLLYHRTDEGKPEAIWKGSAVLDEVGLEAASGVKLAGLVGTALMQGRWTDGAVAVLGNVRIQQGKIAGKDISNTEMVIEKAEGTSTVWLRDIEGEFYGGRIEGLATLGLTRGGKYAFDLAATNVDFERLLREGLRLEHHITGGRLRATLGLRAQGPDVASVEASGYADVTDAQLYRLPIVVRALNLFRLAPAEQTAFQKARILYFLRGKRLILGDIRLEGRALNLYGAGTMEPDGQLNLTFMTGKPNDNPLVPAFSELMEGIRKQIVVVLVTGTLAEPKVELRTLSAVTNPIREVLGLVREQRLRERQTGPK